jgi:hypothetical protein
MATHQLPALVFQTPAIRHAAVAANGPSTVDRVLASLTAGLTPFERSVWLALLDDVSIDALATQYRASSAALQRCITGDDGMTSKNPWVARWWAARQQLQPR